MPPALTKRNYSSVLRDQSERALSECFARGNFMPWRRTGRMRQRNQIETVPCMGNKEFAADYAFQFRTLDKSRDRQPTDRNDQTRLHDSNLVVHPGCTVTNFIRRRDAVAAAGTFSRETTANRGEINFRSDSRFVHSAKFFEPPEECFTGSMGKRSFQCRFPRAGRLPNDHDIANDRAAGNRCRLHARAAPAAQQPLDVHLN